jgi:subtilisin family serine protease
VPFDENIKGDPFRGDYAARADHERWDELEWQLHRQSAELAQRRFEPAIRHQLTQLQRRRRQPAGAGQASGEPPAGVTQFDVLPTATGPDTLLASGEILITGRDYDGREQPGREPPDRTAKAFLDALGLSEAALGCAALEGRVVRLTHDNMTAEELADVVQALQARGFDASLSNILPTGPVAKAIGGPLPVDSPGPFEPDPDPGPGPAAKVAVIDTGIAEAARADGWLRDVRRDPGDIDPLRAFPVSEPDEPLDLDAGHGTFVSGIIQQVARGAQISVYRAVDSDGIASEVKVACEMIRAVEEGAEIINLSLGGQTPDNGPPIAIQAALDVIRKLEREQGREVVLVAAAGNYGDSVPCWPGAFRRVVSVAALAPDLLPATWSSRGFWVNCSTIGQGLRSTYVTGEESVLVDPDQHRFGPDAWAVWSGTSFAVPQIVGALARLRQNHGWPPRQALVTLLSAGRPLPAFGQALKILPGI